MGGTALTNLTQAFLDDGHFVEVVTLAPELKGESLVLEGPRLRMFVAPARLRPFHQARDAFREERRNLRRLLHATSGPVINAHWTYEFALAAMGIANRATLVTAHDSPFTVLRYARDRRYRAVRAAMAMALRVRRPPMTAVSPYIAAVWRRQMLYGGRIDVVPNVVPPVRLENRRRIDGHDPTILVVADADRLKNVEVVIRAMPAILASTPRARLRLVGRGLTHASGLARLAERVGILGSVEFVGRVDRGAMAGQYASADMLVHPSLDEACPMSVAEAMAHGLPVIGGRESGGVPWLLDEGLAGLLVDVKNPVDIARGVSELARGSRLLPGFCAGWSLAGPRTALSAGRRRGLSRGLFVPPEGRWCGFFMFSAA